MQAFCITDIYLRSVRLSIPRGSSSDTKNTEKTQYFWSGAPARNRTSIAGSAILRPIR